MSSAHAAVQPWLQLRTKLDRGLSIALRPRAVWLAEETPDLRAVVVVPRVRSDSARRSHAQHTPIPINPPAVQSSTTGKRGPISIESTLQLKSRSGILPEMTAPATPTRESSRSRAERGVAEVRECWERSSKVRSAAVENLTLALEWVTTTQGLRHTQAIIAYGQRAGIGNTAETSG